MDEAKQLTVRSENFYVSFFSSNANIIEIQNGTARQFPYAISEILPVRLGL